MAKAATRSSNSTATAEVTEAGDEVVLSLYLAPVPASRPRVTRWGVYYTKTYREWMKLAEAAIPALMQPPLEGPLTVIVEFACHRPPTTKLVIPKGDIDNYLKSIFDVLTKRGYWNDDVQIAEVRATKRFAAKSEPPQTRIWISTKP